VCLFSEGRALDRAPARDKVNYQDDQSYDQQEMNQVATHVTEESQKPQDQQYHQYCPQHYSLSFVKSAPF
jgi:hypothetical protein